MTPINAKAHIINTAHLTNISASAQQHGDVHKDASVWVLRIDGDVSDHDYNVASFVNKLYNVVSFVNKLYNVASFVNNLYSSMTYRIPA